jgi:hypothetical protein
MSGFFLWKSAEASGIQYPSLHHKLFIILIFLNTSFCYARREDVFIE